MLSLQSLPLYSVSPFPDLYMTPYLQEAHDASLRSKDTVVGSGNWGSVRAKLIASNTLRFTSFHDEVRIWVFEDTLPRGEKLTDVINKTNENVKSLPGIMLGKNVIADPDLENAVKDANMLVFVTGLLGKLRQMHKLFPLLKEWRSRWMVPA